MKMFGWVGPGTPATSTSSRIQSDKKFRNLVKLIIKVESACKILCETGKCEL